ncbi:MAG: hypothetical protein ACTSUE_01710 [Promethearchaeota archaeon]
MMESFAVPPRVPEWEDINDIIKHLQYALDTLDDGLDDALIMRARIARTIATMRAEKSIEQAIDKIFGFGDAGEGRLYENLILYHEPPFLGIA